jgi:hypothetical protein
MGAVDEFEGTRSRSFLPITIGTCLASPTAPSWAHCRGRSTFSDPRVGTTYSRIELFATEHMIYREGVATNVNDASTFRPFDCSCQQHAFFLIRIHAFPTGCSPRRSSRPSHLGHDPAAVTWDGTGSWWRTPTTTRLQVTAWSHAPSAVLQIKRAMPRHGAPSSTISIALMIAWQRRIQGAGEKVEIKPNLNNTTDHGTIYRLNSSPHLILSLVRQLTGPKKVTQSSITVFDTSRFISGNDRQLHEGSCSQ